MSHSIKVGEIVVGECEKRSGTIKVPGMSVSRVEVPITIIRGRPGPTLCVLAGEHGCEYAGVEACIRLSKNICEKELKGTLIILPIVNVPAFNNRTPYVCPIDNVDLSLAWPGNHARSNTISYLITNVLFNEVVKKSDFLISLHGGDLVESLSDPIVLIHRTGNEKVDKISEDMAKVYGIEHVLEYKVEKGDLLKELTERGVPTIVPETGGEGKLEEKDVEILYEGVVNVMKYLGMLSGKPAIKVKPRLLEKSCIVKSDKAGLFYSHVQIGDIVSEEEVIGEIRNVKGETIQKLKAPMKGKVIFKYNSLPYDSSLGWYLYYIYDVDNYSPLNVDEVDLSRAEVFLKNR